MQRVLVIEDVLDIQKLIHNIFMCDGGYCLDFCQDGYKGLQAVKLQAYDVIITDIIMPDMDGLEFLQQLRRLERNTRPTPVLAMSGGARCVAPKTALKAAAIYADDTIRKPFDPIEFREKIQRLLKKGFDQKDVTMHAHVIG